jgi:hypothetical protein
MKNSFKKNVGLLLAGLLALALWGQPLAAQTDVLVVDGTSVGILDSTPTATLDIFETDSAKNDRVMVHLTGADFYPQFEYTNQSTGKTWRIGINNSNQFVMNEITDLTIAEFKVTPDGGVFVNNTTQLADYVFDEGYELMPLDSLREFIDQNGHLPNVVTEAERQAQGGLDIARMPVQLLEKVEELTLYTLEQHDQIKSLMAENERLLERIEALEQPKERRGRK